MHSFIDPNKLTNLVSRQALNLIADEHYLAKISKKVLNDKNLAIKELKAKKSTLKIALENDSFIKKNNNRATVIKEYNFPQFIPDKVIKYIEKIQSSPLIDSAKKLVIDREVYNGETFRISPYK